MEWIFSAFLVVSMIHMGEEYFYPGGFMDVMKRLNPRFAPAVSVPMAVVINGLQLVLCAVAAVARETAPVLSMSVGGLLLINGIIHIMACIRVRRYVPGVISGVLLYIPLSAYGYILSIGSGALSVSQAILTGVLGLLYQVVPVGYLAVASQLGRKSSD